jgi:hypothetical protein
MTEKDFIREYSRLGHAIQTGVMHEHELGSQDGTPKHLRTGLACVMADVGSLTRLLVAKGIITNDDYYTAILDGLRREVAIYESRLAAKMGAAITLL